MISSAKKADPIVDLVNENLKKLSAARAPVIQAATVKTVAENAGHKVLVVDLGSNMADFDTQVKVDVEGYAVTFAKAGSDRFAVAMELVGAGIYGPMFPGLTVAAGGRFKGIVLRRWGNATVPKAGASTFTSAGAFTYGRYLTLVVAKIPEARFVEASNDNAGFHTYRASTQTTNVATNANAIGTWDGISARGARAIRASVFAISGNITAGSVRWYWTPTPDGSGGNWGYTGFEQPLPLAPAYPTVHLPEFEAQFSTGRYFAEANVVTDSGASATVLLLMQSYGEGGDLNAGDVRP